MITTNLAEVIGVLNGIHARVVNTKPVMERIAEHRASKALLDVMQDKHDPEGKAWADWRPSTRESREKKGNVAQGLLWDKGTYLASIQAQTTAHSVAIGSNNPVAGFLQFGTSRMVARPVFGWSEEDTTYAERLLVRHIEGI